MTNDILERTWRLCNSDTTGRCEGCPLYDITDCRIALEKLLLAEVPKDTDTAKADTGKPDAEGTEDAAADDRSEGSAAADDR